MRQVMTWTLEAAFLGMASRGFVTIHQRVWNRRILQLPIWRRSSFSMPFAVSENESCQNGWFQLLELSKLAIVVSPFSTIFLLFISQEVFCKANPLKPESLVLFAGALKDFASFFGLNIFVNGQFFWSKRGAKRKSCWCRRLSCEHLSKTPKIPKNPLKKQRKILWPCQRKNTGQMTNADQTKVYLISFWQATIGVFW